MITVVLHHPNGNRQDMLLAGVPRVGESIQPANGPSGQTLIVESIVWIEGTPRDPEPQVLAIVRPRDRKAS